MLAKVHTQFSRAIHTEHQPRLDKLMACVRNESLKLVSAESFDGKLRRKASAECIGEDLSANNRKYTVLEGSGEER